MYQKYGVLSTGSMAPNQGRKRVTLKDVARESGYSVQTASHVLSGNKTVRLPETTRQKIKEVADQLGYVPNPHAQSIRSGKTNTIAVWMPIDRPTIAYLKMLAIVGEKAKETGYDLIIVGLDRTSALTTTGRPPHRWPVDGIFSIDAEKAVEVFRQKPGNADLPVAILGFQQFDNGDSVAWNLGEAYNRATQSLIAKGRKHIVHVTLDWIVKEFPREQRRCGYTEAMLDAGLNPVLIPVTGESSQDAADAVAKHLNEGHPVDAIMGVTDTIALGAARALIESRKSIPQDCMVWGQGDYPESANYMVPVSTLRPPLEDAIGQAWDWLMDRIKKPGTPTRFISLPMELVERNSTQTS